ncbi:MAG: hypothetical protein OJF47_000780 [Nitrospira sp.]|nr:MAG: hypothetical protein OJF47_000780 [Nitrospira sp.]
MVKQAVSAAAASKEAKRTVSRTVSLCAMREQS